MRTLLSLLFLIPFVGLAGQQDKKFEVVKYKDGNTLPSYVKYASDAKPLYTSFVAEAENILKLTPGTSFKVINSSKDQIGFIHYRLQELFHNIPVDGAVLNVHVKQNYVESYNGDVFKITCPYSASLSETAAYQLALKQAPSLKYEWQTIKNGKRPVGELYFLCKNGDNATGDFHLSYRFDIYSLQPLKRAYIFIDGITGEVLHELNRIHTSDAIGSAKTKFSGVQAITTDANGGSYRLQEASRNGIYTYNLKKGTDYTTAIDFTDSDNNWDNVNSAQDEVATDAHWATEKTYDYYLSNFARNGYDNMGATMTNYVHYDVGYANAFWNGSGMTYGDGTSGYYAFAALDVCGHEITHAVTQFSANLNYQNESGALNESFSDIFGTAIEFYARPGRANWLMGEDITVSGAALRDMSNPNSYSDPDTYKGNFWVTGTQDNGGVHTNSNVQNYWFYLLSQGGTVTTDFGKTYTVDPLGINKAAAIAYRVLTVYLNPYSTYNDAYNYGLIAAADLYGAGSNEVIQTDNAWHAVGLGAGSQLSYWIPQVSGFSNANTNIFNVSAADTSVVYASASTVGNAGTPVWYTKTINGGNSWTPVSITGTDSMQFANITAVSPSTVYAALFNGVSNKGGRILKSLNGGTTWTVSSSSNMFSNAASFLDFTHFFNSTDGVAVGDPINGAFEIYTTSDGGSTWNQITSGLPAPVGTEAGYINVYGASGNNLWFGTNQGRIYYSNDKGLTWSVSITSLTKISRITFKNATTGIAADGNTLLTTNDGGYSWNLLTNPPFTVSDISYLPGSTQSYVATDISAGSFLSTDGGQTWSVLDNLMHSALAFVNDKTGWSGCYNVSPTSAGMYKWQLNSVVSCPDPSIHYSGSSTLCDGKTILLTASTGSTYKWYLNGNVISGATASTFLASNGGVYDAQVITASGCSKKSNTVALKTNLSPSKPTITRNGNVLTSSTSPSYMWYKNGNAIAGASGKSYTATKTGLYKVRAYNSCGVEYSDSVEVLFAGINEAIGNNELTIAPNPYKGVTTLNLSLKNNSFVIIEAFNIIGEKISTIEEKNLTEGNYKYSLTTTGPGVYFVKTVINGKQNTYRVVEIN